MVSLGKYPEKKFKFFLEKDSGLNRHPKIPTVFHKNRILYFLSRKCILENFGVCVGSWDLCVLGGGGVQECIPLLSVLHLFIWRQVT